MIVEEIKKLQQMIDQSRRIVFFGGAGVSTESGIPDFRSEDGLYHKQYDWPPETIISHSFFMAHPEGLSPIGTQCEPMGLNAVYGEN